MIKMIILLLFGAFAFCFFSNQALGDGPCLSTSAGYLLLLGGNEEDLKNAPSFGTSLEYNFSMDEVSTVGLIYIFSRHGIEDQPIQFHIDQHTCLLGYRFAKSSKYLNLGSNIGMGAVVRDPGGGYKKDSEAVYAFLWGINLRFRFLTGLEFGPDVSFLMTTDMDKWIFGGQSSYFINLGGHVSLYF